MISSILSVLLPLAQDSRHFHESVVPDLMARVDPYYPDGPPAPAPPRPLEVMARPEFTLDDVASETWRTNCSLPSRYRDLSENAPVFYTALQHATAPLSNVLFGRELPGYYAVAYGAQ